ncbi:MAG: hypothetical protein IJC36_01290 [Clostridia bacterium]|nr:hypothetical protein [Clostridia bacterium]
MKKFLAVLFSVVILATFMAVPTLALDSPGGKVIHTVEITTIVDGEEVTTTEDVEDGDTITLTLDDNTGWEITGDYEIVSGTLTSDTLVIRPLGDLVVEAVYDDTDLEGGEDTEENDSDKAPQTGNNAIMMVVLVTAGAFVAMVATRKAVRS